MDRTPTSRTVRSASFRLGMLALAVATASATGCVKRSNHQVSRSAAFADDPHISLDGNGHGLGIWTESQSSLIFDFNPDDSIIVAAAFDAATGFAAPVDVYTLGPSYSPRVGMHADGSAHATWISKVGRPASFRYALIGAWRSASGNWTLETVHESPDWIPAFSLATNRRGDALLAWWSDDQVFASIVSAGSSTSWSAPIALGVQDPLADHPVVKAALGPSGDGVVLRSLSVAGTSSIVAHHFRVGDDPLVAVPIDDGLGYYIPLDATKDLLAATVDVNGAVTAAWLAPSGVGETETAVNRYEPGTGWLGASTFAGSGYVTEVFLACDLSGTVRLEWRDSPGMFRTEYSSLGWIAPTLFFPDASAWGALAIAPNGNAISVGTSYESPESSCVADLLTQGSSWSGVRKLPETDYAPDADIDESGLAVALSLVDREENPLDSMGDVVVVATIWQAPSVTIDPPPLASPGVEIALSAASTRLRTPEGVIVLCEWDFESDGVVDATFTDAQGLYTSHTYSQPGLYDVTLHVVDSWAYRASSRAQVSVSDGGGDGPPWRLFVQETGGTGVVTSGDDDDGDGIPDINCPTDCEDFYGDGLFAYLHATPDAGFVFDHWDGLDSANGDMDYGVEGCTVHMVAHRTITAVFVAD